MAANQPTLIPEAWASQGSRTNIPDTTAETGRASWALGFPPETALPLGAGGVPPHWLDFQGVLHALSSHAVFQQQGGRYGWESTLDYPVGACVLGSDGHVYQASQASGPGTAAGAKNPANGGNAAYWGEAATPDGSTIRVVNGKLTVNNASVAPLLADGVTTVNNAGKITVDLAAATAAALKKISQYVAKSDGGLRMDSASGKLVVDFSLMPTSEFESIVQGMVQTGGGLAVDSSGKLYVDFDTMPTDKFEALLSSLKMQIPLTANMAFHVATNDAAASDVIDTGRGTEQKPFKTIRACINYITQNYALGGYVVTIYVHPGTYTENNISFPNFTRTTGYINIVASDLSNPPAVVSSSLINPIVLMDGGEWRVTRISFRLSVSDDGASFSRFPQVFSVNSGVLRVYGCTLYTEYTGAAPISPVSIIMFNIQNGSIVYMMPFEGYQTSFEYYKGNTAGFIVFNLMYQGEVRMASSNTAPVDVPIYDISCRGDCNTFLRCDTGSLFSNHGSGNYKMKFAIPSGATATGKEYSISGGSGVVAPAGGFPGDVSGTVDASTYSWYKSN